MIPHAVWFWRLCIKFKRKLQLSKQIKLKIIKHSHISQFSPGISDVSRKVSSNKSVFMPLTDLCTYYAFYWWSHQYIYSFHWLYIANQLAVDHLWGSHPPGDLIHWWKWRAETETCTCLFQHRFNSCLSAESFCRNIIITPLTCLSIYFPVNKHDLFRHLKQFYHKWKKMNKYAKRCSHV